MKWLKNLFKKEDHFEDEFDWIGGSDATLVPNDWKEADEMTTSEALEEVLRRLDIIEEKINKLKVKR